jgi:hypothetical protein
MRNIIARTTIVVVVLAFAGSAAAQPAPPPPAMPPPPPKLEALPEVGADVELEPQVTITRKENETIEEARVNGRLMWIKVTPRHGKAYYLIPRGDDFAGYVRREVGESGLRVPMWVILEF